MGIAILFKNAFKLDILKEIKDPGGSFLIVSIKIHEHSLYFICIFSKPP
jgi:hypothetical protein